MEREHLTERSELGKITIAQSLRTIWPFYGALGLCLALVTYVPAFSLWLPGLFK